MAGIPGLKNSRVGEGYAPVGSTFACITSHPIKGRHACIVGEKLKLPAFIFGDSPAVYFFTALAAGAAAATGLVTSRCMPCGEEGRGQR